MIRYILKIRSCDGNCGQQSESVEFTTIDGDAAEVERRLRSGGRGPMGFEITELVGVQIIDEATDGGAKG